LFFSTFLVCKIITSNGIMNALYLDQERNRLKVDVYLSFISILFNVFQYFFSFLIFIYTNEQSVIFFLCINLFYLSYAFNFFFLLLANSLFRQQFYSIFRRSQANNTVVTFERRPMFRSS